MKSMKGGERRVQGDSESVGLERPHQMSGSGERRTGEREEHSREVG